MSKLMQLPFDNREVVLRVDSDQFDPGRDVIYVPVRADAGPRPPQAGEFVYLLDGNGNGCVAFCSKVRDGVARVHPVPETWIGPGHQHASRPSRDFAVHPPARARDHGGVHKTLSADLPTQ